MVIYLGLTVQTGLHSVTKDIDVWVSDNTSALLPSKIWVIYRIDLTQENKRLKHLYCWMFHSLSLNKAGVESGPKLFLLALLCFFVIFRHSKRHGWWVLNEIDFAIMDAHSPDLALQFMAVTFPAISTWIYGGLFVPVKQHSSLLHTHIHAYTLLLSSMENPSVAVTHSQAAAEGI